jgi:hypothetical protein
MSSGPSSLRRYCDILGHDAAQKSIEVAPNVG